MSRPHSTNPGITPPYGFRVEGGRLIPDKAEADAVRWLFGRFAEGASLSALARDLGDAGTGERLGRASVRAILRSRRHLALLPADLLDRGAARLAVPERPHL